MDFNSQYNNTEIFFPGNKTEPTDRVSVYLGGNASDKTTKNVLEILANFDGRIIVSTDTVSFLGTPEHRKTWERAQQVQAERNGVLVFIYDTAPTALDAFKLGAIAGPKNSLLVPHESRRIIICHNNSFPAALITEIQSLNMNIVIFDNIDDLAFGIKSIAVNNDCEHV